MHKKTAIDFSNEAMRIFDRNTAVLRDSPAKRIIQESIDFVVNGTAEKGKLLYVLSWL